MFAHCLPGQGTFAEDKLLFQELWCYTLPYSNSCLINFHNTGGKNSTIDHENPNYNNNNTNSTTNNNDDA